jgi:hypothetical protein
MRIAGATQRLQHGGWRRVARRADRQVDHTTVVLVGDGLEVIESVVRIRRRNERDGRDAREVRGDRGTRN